MMFDQLSSAIGDIAKSFGPKQKMTEKSIAPALRDVRRALLDADVNIQVADSLIEGVKKRALGKVVTEGVTADQQFIKNMYDELLDMMGGDSNRGKRPGDTSQSTPAATLATGTAGAPAIVLLAGLQGAGKTTAAGKLALFLKEREVDYAAVAAMDPKEVSQTLVSRLPKTQRKVLLAAADVYRPAAIKQLQILGESIDVDVFTMGTDADPVEIALQAVSKAKAEGYDTVIVDTAGRQIIDDTLMEELRRIQQAGMYTRNLASSPLQTGLD
jgi:signal recognition particle subunit SRP54